MLRWITSASIRFKTLVLAAAAALLIVGTTQLRAASVDVLPEFTAPVVQVQTESLGLSANEVEELITVPMEQDLLNGVKGALAIRSHSVPGLSSIELVFAPGTSVLEARQLVQERLTQAHALPNVSRPPQMLEPVSSAGHVMIVGLSSRRLSPIELSVLARWTVRPRLMGLAGVANVAIWGQRERQLQVLVDPERLRDRGVSLSQVVSTAGNAQLVSPLSFLEASTPGTGGFIDGPNQRLSVRHVLPFGTPRDLAQVPVENTAGSRRVRLGDVATVVEGHQPLIGDAIVRGGPGLLLVVDKLPGANTLAVTRELDRALEGLAPGLRGVTVDHSVFRPATFVENAVRNIELLLALAGALALLAIVAFRRRWRAVLVHAVAIPMSLVAALVLLHATGQSVNALVVAGLAMALGVVIDDALSEGGSRGSLGYATAIVLLAVAPVLVAEGLTATFVHPMALAFALAVAASMAVALTVTPALDALLASRPPRAPRPSRMAQAYGRLLERVVRTPAPALLGACALGIAGLAVAAVLMQPHAPSFRERDLLVRLNAASGTSLPEMGRITRRITHDLQRLPGVRGVGADVGRAVTGDQAVGTGSGEVWVSLGPGADWHRTLASVRAVAHGVPGVGATVQTYESERSAGVLRGPDDSLTVRVYGQDYGVLHREATKLAGRLAAVEGVRDPRVERPPQQPTVRVRVDLGAALRHGVKPGDVRRAAATLLSGITVGDFFERQKVFEVVVRGVASTHGSLTSVRDLVLDRPADTGSGPGGHVRLGDVADVRIVAAPVDIRHDAVSRYVDVRAQVSGRDMGAVRGDVQRELRRSHLPLEYHAELPAAASGDRTTGGAFAILALGAALGVFLLLQAAFGSWRLALLFFLVLPAALCGGVAAAVASGHEHSLGAVGGLLAVFALAVRQGIVLIRHLQELERGEGALAPSRVLDAMRRRAAPVVASAVTVALAFLPAVALGDVAGNEITHPLAITILGGLATTVAAMLFLVPAAYLGAAGPVTAVSILERPEWLQRSLRRRPRSGDAAG